MNDSEKVLSAFSQMYFYKEMVQDSLCFTPEGDTERELADLLLNLGDLIVAIQLKARNEREQTTDQETELNWLNKKCKAAKKQIKDTRRYILSKQLPEFQNNRGQKVSVKYDAKIIPLIVFINSGIKHYPHVLKKHSENGINVNCISFPDFQAMCKALVTPIEIVSYLEYRQKFYEANPEVDLMIYTDEHDNTILTKPMKEEALVFQFLANEYGVQKISESKSHLAQFQGFLHATPEHTVVESEENANYALLLFLAHFNRIEIKTFLERVHLALKKSKNNQCDIVGSMRRGDGEYAIFFVASKPNYKFPMDNLLQLARQKSDVKKLLQVVVYWENDVEFRIDYFLMDSTNQNH